MVDNNIDTVKVEILAYLRSHPDASDDLQGISRFWLARQRIETATLLVHEALEALVREGLLLKVIRSTSSHGHDVCRYQIVRDPDDTA